MVFLDSPINMVLSFQTVPVTSCSNFRQSQKHVDLVLDSPSNIVHEVAMEDDPRQRKPDISTAQREINWKPKVSHTTITVRTLFLLLQLR